MARFEVPQELRPGLIEKALSGETLDADVPGAVPVSTETVTNDYGTYPVKRYSDGSFDSAGVTDAETSAGGNVSAKALKDCQESGDASGQKGTCQAYHWTLRHNMWYYFDYEWLSSGTSEIVDMYEKDYDSGNSCQTDEFGPYQKYGSVGDPAKGRWSMACTDVVGASSSKSLGIRVEPFKIVWTVQNY